MIDELKESLWRQFGASIDMLDNAIRVYPEAQWQVHPRIFYMSYHTLVFLDYYLTMPSPAGFSAALPFTLVEPENIPPDALDDLLPDRMYTKDELLTYLHASRVKCRTLIDGLTEEKIKARWIEEDGGMNYSQLEILLYNMRHVQHHAAQLNLLLRQHTGVGSKWVARGHN